MRHRDAMANAGALRGLTRHDLIQRRTNALEAAAVKERVGQLLEHIGLVA
jgi:hypothetical protein